MGASINTGGGGGGGRRRRSARHRPMSEINVTPFVDVMLVLLIIFMVAAPLMTAGVPIDLPDAKGKQLDSNKEPLRLSVKANGDVFIGDTPVTLDKLVTTLRERAKSGTDEPIFVWGDKGARHGTMMEVMSRISRGGFKKVSFITEGVDGG